MKPALRRAYPALKDAKRRQRLAPPGYKAKRAREFTRAMTEILMAELKKGGSA